MSNRPVSYVQHVNIYDQDRYTYVRMTISGTMTAESCQTFAASITISVIQAVASLTLALHYNCIQPVTASVHIAP